MRKYIKEVGADKNSETHLCIQHGSVVVLREGMVIIVDRAVGYWVNDGSGHGSRGRLHAMFLVCT